MSDAVGREVVEARRALQEGLAEEALERALAAWRAQRSPLLAELVERIDALLDAAPLRAAPEAWHEAWLARESARRPADLGALLGALVGPGDGSETWLPAFQRLERLEGWPDDPRLAAGLAALFEAPPFSSPRSAPFYAKAASVLVRQRDPRASQRLRTLRQSGGGGAARPHVGPALKEAIDRLKLAGARKAAPLDPSIEALARAAVEACPRPHLDELLERVYAEPDDDGARAAYAAALLARGDARGEHILLALRRRAGEGLGAEERRRADALLEAHRAAWQGPLSRCALPSGAVFERGFPSGLTVVGDAAAVAELRGHPALSTLREIDLRFAPHGFVHPVLRHVRKAHVKDADLVAFATTEAGASLEELEWDGPAVDEAARLDEAVVRALSSPEALPRLRLVRLRPSGRAYRFIPACLAPLLDAPFVARLARLSCAFDLSGPELGRWLAFLAARAPRLASLELTPSDHGANLVLRLDRGPDGGLTALSADVLPPRWGRSPGAPDRREALHALARELEELDPGALTALHIDGDRAARPEPEQLAELERATGRLTQLDAASRAELAARARWAASRRGARQAEVIVTASASGEARAMQTRAMDLVPEQPGRARLVWIGPVLFLVPGRDDRDVRFAWSAASQVWNPVEDGDDIEVGARRFRVTIEDVAGSRDEEPPFEATYETWVALAHRRSISHRGAVRAETAPGSLTIGPIAWKTWGRRRPPAIDAALGDLFEAALLMKGHRAAGAPTVDQVRQRLDGVYAPNLGVEGEQLVCMVPHDGWRDPQDRQLYFSVCGQVPLASLPLDEPAFIEVVARLQSAASWMMQGAVLACRFCRKVHEPTRMHAPAVCPECAVRWLGVVPGIP